jgi:hypothetical protein
MKRLASACAAIALGAASLATLVTAQAQAPGPASKPLATRELDADGIVADVIESTRKDGVLTVRVRFRNVTDKPVKFLLSHAGRYDDNYISAANTKYKVIRDAKGNVVATPTDGGGWIEPTIKPKSSFAWWAKFPAPPAEQKTYSGAEDLHAVPQGGSSDRGRAHRGQAVG